MLWGAGLCFCVAIVAAVAGLSGTDLLPFHQAIMLSLGALLVGIALIFTKQKPPKS